MFDKYVAPRVKAQFAGSGAAFTSRQGDAVANALGDMTLNLQKQHGDLLNQSLFNNAQFQEAALGRALQATQATNPQLAGSTALMSSMQPFFNEFMRTAPESNPYLSQAMAYISNNQGAMYNPQSSLASSLTGGALGLAALGKAGFFGSGTPAAPKTTTDSYGWSWGGGVSGGGGAPQGAVLPSTGGGMLSGISGAAGGAMIGNMIFPGVGGLLGAGLGGLTGLFG